MSSHTFRQQTHSLPWRTAFEAHAAAVWALCALVSVFFAFYSSFPKAPFLVCAGCSLLFAALRLSDASEVWNLRINLLGKNIMLMPIFNYLQHCVQRPNELWLGKGFLWEKHHSQRLYDLRRAEQKNVMPPEWYSKLRGTFFDQQPKDTAGLPWIHGVGDKEEDIHLPFSLLEGNSLILGTTGSGKSTLLRIIAAACIRRGDCVILLDPKGDKSLVDALKVSCENTPGRENDFVYFHSAFAQKSVRYDVMANFDRVTSLASRISNQIPSKTGSDQFVAFSWRVLLVNSQLLVAAGERPTIARIRRYVEGGIEPLLERVLATYFDEYGPKNWRAKTAPLEEDAKEGKIAKPSRSTPDRIAAYVEYYKKEIALVHPSDTIEAGINLYTHDRSHYGKMISSLMPTLAMLDAGELGGLLSPKYDDIDDQRPVFNSDKVVEGNKVMYIGLDALSDSVVSSAIGSIIVSDLASVAGARYNYGDGKPRRITLIIDEANEVVSAPFHQLASKGRGSGFTLWAASQTIPDYIARLGSQDKALSALGNFNNLITLRIKDAITCEFVAEQIGKAFVDSMQFGLNTSAQSDTTLTGFTGGENVSLSDKLIEVVPPDMFGMLPNHQYFALLAGGKLYKGRQPVVY